MPDNGSERATNISNIIMKVLSLYDNEQDHVQATKLAKRDIVVVDMQWETTSNANN